MNGPRDDAIFCAFAVIAQIDKEQGRVTKLGDRIPATQGKSHAFEIILAQTDIEIGWNRHIHHFRVRQVQVFHDLHISGFRRHLKPGVVVAFLGDRADHITLIIMGRIHQSFVRQLEQLVENGIVLSGRAAVLKIRSASSADKQCIAGKHPVTHQETVGIICVSRRVHHIESQSFDVDPIAFGHPHRDHIHTALFAHDRDALRAVAQLAQPRDVVSMDMGIHGLNELQIEFLEKLQIAINLLQHRINDQGFTAAAARKEIGVGARFTIEQLAEDHAHIPGQIKSHQL